MVPAPRARIERSPIRRRRRLGDYIGRWSLGAPPRCAPSTCPPPGVRPVGVGIVQVPSMPKAKSGGLHGRRSVVAQGGGVAASAVPQNSQNFSKLSEFSEFSEFLEFFRIFAKSLKFQNFRKIQNFRSLYGIFSRIVKGGDPNIALYLPKVIYYSAFFSPQIIYHLAPHLSHIIYYSAFFSPEVIYYSLYFPQVIYRALLPRSNILPIPSHPIPSHPPGSTPILNAHQCILIPIFVKYLQKKPSKMHQSISSALTHSHLSHLMTCPSLRVDDPLLGGHPSSLVVMHT